MKTCLRNLLAISLILPAAGIAAAPTGYSFMDVGSLGGTYVIAYGINDSGQVAGYSYAAGNTGAHGFRTAPHQPINPATDDIGLLGPGVESNAMGINESGQVVGWGQIPPYASYLYRAIRTGPNQTLNAATDNLGSLGGNQTVARGINDTGVAVGYGQTASGIYHAFRVPAGRPINAATDDIGLQLSGASRAHAINNAGQIVGYYTGAGNNQRAFRTTPGLAINPLTDDLGTLGGLSSSAWDINAAGQVVGASTIASQPYVTHAFLTGPNQALNAGNDLGTLPGYNYSEALAVNDAGWVVGRCFNLGTSLAHAFLYDGTQMFDLNNLTDPPEGYVLTEALDINNLGQIVGSVAINGTITHGFVLTIVPEPSPALLVALGALLLAPCRAWTRRGGCNR